MKPSTAQLFPEQSEMENLWSGVQPGNGQAVTWARCLGLGRDVLRAGAREQSQVWRALDIVLRTHSFFWQASGSLCVGSRHFYATLSPVPSLTVSCSSIDFLREASGFPGSFKGLFYPSICAACIAKSSVI